MELLLLLIAFTVLANTEALLKPKKPKNTTFELINKRTLIITKGLFRSNEAVEKVNIINCDVAILANESFLDLKNLKEVDLSRNQLTALDHTAFRPYNKIWKLDISYNLFTDLENFELTYFPELKLFNISGNFLMSLPIQFARKLNSDPDFTLVVTGNPWDCDNDTWTQYFSKEMYEQFCFEEELPIPLAQKIPAQASFVTCIFWIVGAFWVGIIVGNVCLIKKIVFPKPVKADKAVQFDGTRTLSEIFIKSEMRVPVVGKSVVIREKSKEHVLNKEDY